MKELVKFLLYSTGRSGSTAIADELSSTKSIACYQEPIVDFEKLKPEVKERLLKLYQEQGIAFSNAQQGARLHGFGTLKHLDPSISYEDYLERIESYEGHAQKKAFGIKQVHNQLQSFPGFWDEFTKRGYSCLFLTRRNIVRGGLSATVAAVRGLYNTKDNERTKEGSVLVPLDLLDQNIRLFQSAIDEPMEFLVSKGLSPHQIFYEDFLADRLAFHRFIFEVLEIDFEQPDPSGFQKLVPQQLEDFVENYPEVRKFLRKKKLEHFLDEL